jgi:dynein heavy chain 1
LQGDLKPDEAASMLTIYEGKFTRLKDDRENLIKAKEALELADPGMLSIWLTELITS